LAASAAVHAALMTSARRPVTGFLGDAPMTIVSAEAEAKPSMWAPNCIFTTSSFARTCDDCGSELIERDRRDNDNSIRDDAIDD